MHDYDAETLTQIRDLQDTIYKHLLSGPKTNIELVRYCCLEDESPQTGLELLHLVLPYRDAVDDLVERRKITDRWENVNGEWVQIYSLVQ